MLLLHDPHYDPASPNCLSSDRILSAARSIVDLMYKLTSTSYDLLLLDHSCSFCWFVAAVALIRFLKTRILAGDEAEASRVTQEIQVIRFMMSSLGARTIVGLRQNLMLDSMFESEIQPLIDKVIPPATVQEAPSTGTPFGHATPFTDSSLHSPKGRRHVVLGACLASDFVHGDTGGEFRQRHRSRNTVNVEDTQIRDYLRHAAHPS